jgi:Ca-activated chloride channel family protein
MQFEWPWIAVALPLPWLARLWLRADDDQAALRAPVLDDFSLLGTSAGGGGDSRARLLIAAIAWCLLVGAAARPYWLGPPVDVPVSGRDLMLAVDLSLSMEQADFEIGGKMVNRLTATKKVASEFIDRRVGDRIGLILFGRQAYVQTPLTFDRATVKTLLNEAFLGLAGRETAIGDAIGLAVKRLGKDDAEGKQVLILMTDGANTAGELKPLDAAALAAARHLRIHTIGIGADEMVVRSLFGAQRVNPSVDLDEKTLRAIAQATGGQYFRARDTVELDRIYTLLDRIEPVAKDARQYRPRRELYVWPLAASLALVALLAMPRLVTAPALVRTAASGPERAEPAPPPPSRRSQPPAREAGLWSRHG